MLSVFKLASGTTVHIRLLFTKSIVIIGQFIGIVTQFNYKVQIEILSFGSAFQVSIKTQLCDFIVGDRAAPLVTTPVPVAFS